MTSPNGVTFVISGDFPTMSAARLGEYLVELEKLLADSRFQKTQVDKIDIRPGEVAIHLRVVRFTT